ncbi:MAG: beta-L-arabinofuranosidase domain-containing protein [Bryobacteraceae bacterium]
MQKISRRDALGFLGLLAGTSCRKPSERDGDVRLLGQPRRPVADALSPLPLHDVQLSGYLGRKLDLCIRNRIFALDPRQLVEPFRRRQERQCWQTEFWGKWLSAAAAACEYTGNQEWQARLRQSVQELLATQDPDGYIGNYAPDSHLKSWDIWGRKYTLLGLLAWHSLTADPASLEGARRLADHLLSEVGPGKADIVTLGLYRGMASSSVLGPVVELYRRTREERYLRFAEYIVARWYSPRGPHLIEKALAGVPVAERFPRPEKWWSWENGQKAYEMMSCYTGLLELYRETGWKDCLNAAVRTYENIHDTEINVAGSGSADECWYGGQARQAQPAHRAMETCVATSWIELSARLLRITGDARFGDEIEKTAYNALLGAMTPDGSSFAQYSSLDGVRELGPPQCGMNLNCCVANGPRGLMLLGEAAVVMHQEGPCVTLYSGGVWRLRLPSGVFCRLEAKTDYPASGNVDIVLRPERPVSFPLRLRIPAWSRETSLAVNGSPLSGVEPGAWALVERRWRPGDHVSLRLDLRGRILRATDSSRSYVAVARGPLALARDVRLAQPGSIGETVAAIPKEQEHIAMQSVPPPAGIEMAFVAGAGGELPLCDYASAGNTWNDRSRFRVWMPV